MQAFHILHCLTPGALHLRTAKIQENCDAALGHHWRCAFWKGKAFSVLSVICVHSFQATPSEIICSYSFYSLLVSHSGFCSIPRDTLKRLDILHQIPCIKMMKPITSEVHAIKRARSVLLRRTKLCYNRWGFLPAFTFVFCTAKARFKSKFPRSIPYPENEMLLPSTQVRNSHHERLTSSIFPSD